MSALATEAGKILVANLIDAAFVAFEAKLERDALIAQVSEAVDKGLPLTEVSEFIKEMARKAVDRL